jgi:hypothetical protein
VNIFNSKDVIKNAEVLTWKVDLRWFQLEVNALIRNTSRDLHALEKIVLGFNAWGL